MKKLFIGLVLLSTTTFAQMPLGYFKLDSIKCSDGKELKIGGPFFNFLMELKVTSDSMTLVAKVNAKEYSPIRLFCTIANSGEYINTIDGEFKGDLKPTQCVCKNGRGEVNARFTKKVCVKNYGAEALGTAEYSFDGSKLTVKYLDSEMVYSCGEGNVPVYYYHKK